MKRKALFLLIALVGLLLAQVPGHIHYYQILSTDRQGNGVSFQMASTMSGVVGATVCDDGSKNTTTTGCSSGGGSTITVANASSTGTTTSKLAKLTGAPSTAVITGTTDTAGAVGICTSGCGTAGSATITLAGSVSCVFDGATTAGHYIQISTTAGDCHDAGASYVLDGHQVIGRILSTNGVAGTYTIDLFPAEIAAPTDATLSTSDITTNNVSTSKHGFAPKAPNVATQYLDGTGNYSTPVGTGLAGMVLLEEHTASTSSELDFTSCISSSYDTYLVTATKIVTSASTILRWQMSTNGGSSYDIGNNYQFGFSFGYSGGSGGTGSTATSGMQWRDVATTFGTGGSYNGTFTMYDPNGSNNLVMTGALSLSIGGGVSVLAESWNGMYFGATGVNAFRLKPDSGTLTSGTVRCYGFAK